MKTATIDGQSSDGHATKRRGNSLWWQMMAILAVALLFAGPEMGWGLSLFFLGLGVIVRLFDTAENLSRTVFGIQAALAVLLFIWTLDNLISNPWNRSGASIIFVLAGVATFVCVRRLCIALRVHRLR